ncbi:dystroglycan-related [Anaeramoeba flamelloides]|uniref:Dystroglycan-related n=1 Tax=Anaeramoeba flamelloides TaxID=1746091 RepID=A0ABQ8YWN4_9EUKA|nr:dystroglycan-related [Anaeramoeba flamelloides]
MLKKKIIFLVLFIFLLQFVSSNEPCLTYTKMEVGDVTVDQEPDTQICTFDGDATHLTVLVYKGKNLDGFSNIRLRAYEIDEDNSIGPIGASVLMSEEFSNNTLSKPGVLCLEDDRVLVVWADIIKYGEMEDFIFKGVIYNVRTKERGEVVDLNEMFSCRVFSTYVVKRVGTSSDKKFFFTFNYNIQYNNLDNYIIKGQMFTFEGFTITAVGSVANLYDGSKYTETVGNKLYSFPETDKFFILFDTENAAERRIARCYVYQLSSTADNGYERLTKSTLYTGDTAYSLGNIWISGVYGDSFEDTTQTVMISWVTFETTEYYAIHAYLADDNTMKLKDSFLFDPSIELIDFARSQFYENQKKSVVTWNNDNNDIDVDYNFIDFNTSPPEALYSMQEVYRPSNERYWSVNLVTLSNGNFIFAIDGDVDLARYFVKLFYFTNKDPSLIKPFEDTVTPAGGSDQRIITDYFNIPGSATFDFTTDPVITADPKWMSIENTDELNWEAPDICTAEYTVTVSGEGSCGSISDSFTLTIENEAPTFSGTIIPPPEYKPGDVPSQYTFDKTTVTDPESDPITFTTDLPGSPWSFSETSDADNIYFDSSDALTGCSDESEIAITASDDCNGTLTLQIPFKYVNNAPTKDDSLIPGVPTAVAGNEYSYAIGQTPFSDPDSETLTFYGGERPTDGSSKPIVTGKWPFFDSDLVEFSGTTPSDLCSNVVYNMRVQACDSCSCVNYDFDINIENTKPTYDDGLTEQTVNINETNNYRIDTFFSDPNFEHLEYIISEGTESTPQWIKLISTDTETYIEMTGPNECSSSHIITVTAKDNCQQSTEGSFTAKLNNNWPVVKDVAIPNKDDLHTNEEWSYTIQPNAFKDPKNQGLAIEAKLVNPDSSLSDLPDWLVFDESTITFFADPKQMCGDTFTIRVTATDFCNRQANSDFEITVINEKPKDGADPITDQTAIANTEWQYLIPDQAFVDPEGDAFTLTGASDDPTTVQFLATPNYSFYSSDLGSVDECYKLISLSVTATENYCAENAYTRPLILNVTLPLPTYDPIDPISVHPNTNNWVHKLDPNPFTNPSGKPLSYELIKDLNGQDPADLSWLTLNTETGELELEGDVPSECNDYQLRIKATDSECGLFVDGDFELKLESDPPQRGDDIPDQELYVGVEFDYSIPDSAFIINDQDTVTYSAVEKGENTLPNNLQFDANTRQFSNSLVLTLCSSTKIIEVTATGACGFATNNFNLIVENKKPVVANAISPIDLDSNKFWQFQFNENVFDDEDTSALQYSVTDLPAWDNIQFYGDNRTFVGVTPDQCNTETWSINLLASDSCQSQAIDTFTVTVSNLNPVLNQDKKLQNQNLMSDQQLGVSFDQDLFTDPEGHTIAYSASALPTEPSWIIFDDETLAFSGSTILDPNVCTKDWGVTVTAKDNCDLSGTDTFTVTVKNTPPQADVQITERLVNTGQDWEYLIPATAFKDLESDTLTYTITETGQATLPDWMHFDQPNRLYGAVPTSCNSNGWDLTLSAKDTCNPDSPAHMTFHVKQNSSSPIVQNPLPDFNLDPGQQWTYDIPAKTFYDANGDALTLTAHELNSDTLPFGLQLLQKQDGSGYYFIGTLPSDCSAGPWTIVLTADDQCSVPASLQFTITLNGGKPIINKILPDITIYSFRFWFYRIPKDAFIMNDGSELKYKARQANGKRLPIWIYFYKRTAAFWGLPLNFCSKTYQIKVTAYSECGASTSQIFTLDIKNRKPRNNLALKPLDVTYGTRWSYVIWNLAFTDPENEPLAIELVDNTTGEALPDWIMWNHDYRVLYGVAPTTRQTIQIRATAYDCCQQTTSQDFTLSVNPPPKTKSNSKNDSDSGFWGSISNFFEKTINKLQDFFDKI